MDIWILIYSNRQNTYENKKIAETILNNKYRNIKILDPKNIQIYVKKDKIVYYNCGKKISKPQKAYIKVGCMLDEYDKNILLTLEEDGVSVINRVKELEIISDKYRSAYIFNKLKIPFIKTLYVNGGNAKYLMNDLNNTQTIINEFEYPLILKSKKGSLGKGIYKVNSYLELRNMIEQIELLDIKYEYLIQEYIKEGNVDYRVVAFDGKIQYVMQRTAVNNEFRANYTLGADIKLITPNTKIEKIIEKIYTKIPLNIMGVDLIKKNNDYLVCEINANPGFKGYDDLNSLENSFAKKLLDFIVEK